MTVMFTVVQCQCVDYLLYHNTVDAHVSETSGVVEHVHPAESQAQHQKAEVLVLTAQIQHCRAEEEDALCKTVNSTVTV